MNVYIGTSGELKNDYIGERPYRTLTDSFSGTSLDTTKWNFSQIASIGTATVNNSLSLYSPGTGSGNAGGPMIETVKKIDGTEKKITVEATVTAQYNTSPFSIGGQTFNWVSESSVYKCNGNLPICEVWNNTVEVTQSSTSYSGSSNNGKFNTNYTSTLSVPFTIKTELDITNKTIKVYNGNTQLVSASIPSNVNLSNWIGKPVAAMHAIGWNTRSITLSNITITIEY